MEWLLAVGITGVIVPLLLNIVPIWLGIRKLRSKSDEQHEDVVHHLNQVCDVVAEIGESVDGVHRRLDDMNAWQAYHVLNHHGTIPPDT